MAVIARPDEEVDRRVQPSRQLLPGADDLVGVLLRLEPLLGGDPRDLVRMLVHPGQEEGLLASLAVMAHEDVRRGRGVGMADVRASS